MRKYLVGVLIGASLMFSFQVGAATLKGSKVSGTADVKLNGEVIGTAALINGSSYLPVRALADKVGLGVDFKDNTVMLNTNSGDVPEEAPLPEQTDPKPGGEPPIVDVGNFTLKTIVPTIQLVESQIEAKKALMNAYPITTPEEQAEWDKVFADLNAKLEQYKAIKAELERREANQ